MHKQDLQQAERERYHELLFIVEAYRNRKKENTAKTSPELVNKVQK